MTQLRKDLIEILSGMADEPAMTMEKLEEYITNRDINESRLVHFISWVGDGYDFEENAKKIVTEYIEFIKNNQQ